jgi:hypothetical protein
LSNQAKIDAIKRYFYEENSNNELLDFEKIKQFSIKSKKSIASSKNLSAVKDDKPPQSKKNVSVSQPPKLEPAKNAEEAKPEVAPTASPNASVGKLSPEMQLAFLVLFLLVAFLLKKIIS